MTTIGNNYSNSPVSEFYLYEQLETQLLQLNAQVQSAQKEVHLASARLQYLESQYLQRMGIYPWFPNSEKGLNQKIAKAKEQQRIAELNLQQASEAMAQFEKQNGITLSSIQDAPSGSATKRSLLSKEVAEQNTATIRQTQEESLQEQAEQTRQQAFNSITSEMNLELATAADAILRIQNIIKDQNDIVSDQQEEKVLTSEIIKYSVELAAAYAATIFSCGACAPLLAYLAALLAEAIVALLETKANEAAAKADIVVQTKDLQNDMNELSTLSLAGLQDLIHSLITTLSSLLALLGNGKEVSEGQMQKAAAIMAEVMTIVEMITTKIQQKRSAQQEWMSRANAASSEMAVQKSEAVLNSMDELSSNAAFIKMTMKVVQIGAITGSVAIALASGGTLSLTIAVVMTALIASGLLQRAVNALADKMSKNHAIWAKVVADVIATAVLVILTRGAALAADSDALVGAAAAVRGGAARQAIVAADDVLSEEMDTEMTELGAQSARQSLTASETQDDIEMSELSSNSGSAAATAPAAPAMAAPAIAPVNFQAAGNVVNAALPAAQSSFMQALRANASKIALGLLYFGANNGFVDLGELIYAVSTNRANASEAQLANNTTFMILKIVEGVLQSIVEMAAVHYAISGNTQASAIQKLLNRLLKMSKLMPAAIGLQSAATGASSLANISLSANAFLKGQLVKAQGDATAMLNIMKELTKAVQAYERKENELFTEKLEEQNQELNSMIQRNGQAETIASRVLLEAAV